MRPIADVIMTETKQRWWVRPLIGWADFFQETGALSRGRAMAIQHWAIEHGVQLRQEGSIPAPRKKVPHAAA